MPAIDCVSYRIVAEVAPAHRVHETDDCLAFLDTAPAAPGHTLVVPKQHRETLPDAEPDTVGRLFRAVREVTEAVETVLDPDGVNIVQSNRATAGQEIDHLHVHVVPRWTDDMVRIDWPAGDVDPAVADRLAEQVQR